MDARPTEYVLSTGYDCPNIHRIHYDVNHDSDFDFSIRAYFGKEGLGHLLALTRLSPPEDRVYPGIEFGNGSRLKFRGPIGVSEALLQSTSIWSDTIIVIVMFGADYVFLPANFGAAIKQMWI
jgi:hypothetical protein